MEPFRRLFGQGLESMPDSAVSLEDRPHHQPMHEQEPLQQGAKHVWDPSANLRSTPPSPPLLSPTSSSSVDLAVASTAYLASNVMRRSRLDESAGEGLRRSVLVRNAMLSSLERERNSPGSMSLASSVCLDDITDSESLHVRSLFASPRSDRGQDASLLPSGHEGPMDPAAVDPEPPLSKREHFEREVQWFEDLLSELGSDDDAEGDDEDDDFVAIELSRLDVAAPQPDLVDAYPGETAPTMATLADPSPTTDSGFAERRSLSSSAASGPRPGYPYVCPYPSMLLTGNASSEELPALVEDDSDLEDDDDDTPLAEPEQDPLAEALLARPLSPVDAAELDQPRATAIFSPPSTRPGSPTLSASSKAESEHSSPAGGCENLPGLTLLSELALRPGTNRSRYTESLDLALARICQPDVGEARSSIMMPLVAPSTLACHLPWQMADSSRRSLSADSRRPGPCSGVVREFTSDSLAATSSAADSCDARPASDGHDSIGHGVQAARSGCGIVCQWPSPQIRQAIGKPP
ncbi:hypothetical protein ACQY0O_000535 [Thecaphora frezii]